MKLHNPGDETAERAKLVMGRRPDVEVLRAMWEDSLLSPWEATSSTPPFKITPALWCVCTDTLLREFGGTVAVRIVSAAVGVGRGDVQRTWRAYCRLARRALQSIGWDWPSGGEHRA
jgi:hypothetical protein